MVDTAITFIERYSAVLTLVLGAIAVTGVLWRVVLRPMLIALRELAEQMQALRTVAEAQLTPNGGGSLVDKVNQIGPNHEFAKDQWTELRGLITDVQGRVKAIEEKSPTVVIHNEPRIGGGE